MSRSRPAGPSRAGSPSALAWAWTAATCPCGKARVTSRSRPGTTSDWPVNETRTASSVASGNADKFASVSCLTVTPSRYVRRSR